MNLFKPREGRMLFSFHRSFLIQKCDKILTEKSCSCKVQTYFVRFPSFTGGEDTRYGVHFILHDSEFISTEFDGFLCYSQLLSSQIALQYLQNDL